MNSLSKLGHNCSVYINSFNAYYLYFMRSSRNNAYLSLNAISFGNRLI